MARTGWPRGLLAGCLTAAAALAASPWPFAGEAFAGLAVSAVVAAFLLGLTAERVLRRAPATDGVGSLAGIVVALLSHPGMALVFALGSLPTGEFDGARDLGDALCAVTVLSLLVWGWVTVPLGLLGGFLAGRLAMRRDREETRPPR